MDAAAGAAAVGGRPPVGTSIEFLRDPFAFHERRVVRHGPVYKTRNFGRWAVALIGADALEAELMDRERNFSSEKGRSTPVRRHHLSFHCCRP